MVLWRELGTTNLYSVGLGLSCFATSLSELRLRRFKKLNILILSSKRLLRTLNRLVLSVEKQRISQPHQGFPFGIRLTLKGRCACHDCALLFSCYGDVVTKVKVWREFPNICSEEALFYARFWLTLVTTKSLYYRHSSFSGRFILPFNCRGGM